MLCYYFFINEFHLKLFKPYIHFSFIFNIFCEVDKKIKNPDKFEEGLTITRTLESPIGQNKILMALLANEKTHMNNDNIFSNYTNKISEGN